MKSLYVGQNVTIMKSLAHKIEELGQVIISHVAKLSLKEETLWNASIKKSFILETEHGILVSIRRETNGNKVRLVFDFKHQKDEFQHYPFNGLPVDAQIKVAELLNGLYNK